MTNFIFGIISKAINKDFWINLIIYLIEICKLYGFLDGCYQNIVWIESIIWVCVPE